MTSYVESILEDLVGEERPQEALDMEAFSEMMMAYLPQSEFIKVCHPPLGLLGTKPGSVESQLSC